MAPLQDVTGQSETGPPQIPQAVVSPTQHSPLVLLLPILIATLVFLAFRPGLYNEFVTWGDTDTIVTNVISDGPSAGDMDIGWMFRFDTGRYQPLTWLSLAIDGWIGGREPFGYHLTSLALHILNTVLVYALTRRLVLLGMPGVPAAGSVAALGAAAAAAIFGLHPLRVESVVWATARSDVLSTAFYLAGVLAYLHANGTRPQARRRGLWLAGSLVGMALSLLAGNNIATSMLVVVFLDIYPLRRVGGGPGRWFGPAVRGVWREKLPFVALAIVTAILAWLAETHVNNLQGLPGRDLARQSWDSLLGLSLGMWKSCWPIDLSPLYGSSPRTATAAGILLVATGACAWFIRKRWAAPLAAWLWYVLLVLPAIGMFGRNGSISADRYTYVACLGWAILWGAIVTWYLQAASDGTGRKAVAAAASALTITVISVLFLRTSQQCEVWTSSLNLWEHVVEIDPDSFIGRLCLGEELSSTGHVAAASDEFKQAVRLGPGNMRAQGNLGISLGQMGAWAEARKELSRALELAPDNDAVHLWFGRTLSAMNEPEAALEHLRMALRLNPGNLAVYVDIGAVLQKQGRIDAAVANYNEAIRRQPKAALFYTLAGGTLIDAKRFADAAQILRAGMKEADDSVGIANALAWLLACCPDAAYRNGAEAVKLAQFACRATLDQEAGYLDTLATAYAETGRFDDAVRTQKAAISQAHENMMPDKTIREFTDRLSLFEKHQPYREAK